MIRIAFSFFCMMLTSMAFCMQLPKSCGQDARVRCVSYDADEVVAITAMFGLQTFILFASGEEVLDIGGGDTAGWDIGVITKKNGIFIKPKSFKPATNITIITNKRYYNFDFTVEKLQNTEDRNYMTKFTYPEDEVKKVQKTTSKQKTETLFANAMASKSKNDDYWSEGARVFVPTAAWDDGETTYFRFSPNTDLPAVYLVDSDGNETLINKSFPEPYTMAVQTVGRKFIFRKGNIFTCIYNESYDKYGVENQSRTTSPSVRRVIKEEQRDEMDKKLESSTSVIKIIPGSMPSYLGVPSSVPPPSQGRKNITPMTINLNDEGK